MAIVSRRVARGRIASSSVLWLTAGIAAAACTNATVSPIVGNAGAGGSATGGGGAGGSSVAGATITAGTPPVVSAGTGGAATAGSAGAGGAAGGGGAAGAGGTGGAGGSGGGLVCPEGGAGGAADDDTSDPDVDGVPNCSDDCPGDFYKTEPGECGCGLSDLDSDSDTTFDCNDECPYDPEKTAPGVCGCGSSDTANADNDAAVDCLDACPQDPALTTAGACGCLPETLGATCLAHRYQFDGTGTAVLDTIGGAAGDGLAIGATLTGTGTLVLTGGASEQYVELPSGMISAMGESATFEAWVTWAGTGGDWQRIFDFGSSDAGADQQGSGAGYLFLTPRAASGLLRAAVSPAGNGEEDLVDAAAPLPSSLAHVAVVVDGTAKTLALYQNGIAQGTATPIRAGTALTRLTDVNNWLGRSQWAADEELAGTFHEFRIYSRALTAQQIAASAAAGPDALPAP